MSYPGSDLSEEVVRNFGETVRSFFQQYGETYPECKVVPKAVFEDDDRKGTTVFDVYIQFVDLRGVSEALAPGAAGPGGTVLRYTEVIMGKRRARADFHCIVIGGLSSEISEQSIRNYLMRFGTVMEVNIPRKGKQTLAYVFFATKEEAHSVLEVSQHEIGGCPIVIMDKGRHAGGKMRSKNKLPEPRPNTRLVGDATTNTMHIWKEAQAYNDATQHVPDQEVVPLPVAEGRDDSEDSDDEELRRAMAASLALESQESEEEAIIRESRKQFEDEERKRIEKEEEELMRAIQASAQAGVADDAEDSEDADLHLALELSRRETKNADMDADSGQTLTEVNRDLVNQFRTMGIWGPSDEDILQLLKENNNNITAAIDVYLEEEDEEEDSNLAAAAAGPVGNHREEEDDEIESLTKLLIPN
mmetsp:Transcript_44051/g.68870  ORF Transcript_44051/g.68870 Transcript_44051/m.68870 type:complete len:417 (+) Transcript_44051:827-2077(+)